MNEKKKNVCLSFKQIIILFKQVICISRLSVEIYLTFLLNYRMYLVQRH